MLLGYLILYFPIIAVFSLLVYLPIWLIRRKSIGKQPFLRHVTIYALIGCVTSLIYLTILWYGIEYITFHPEYHLLNLVPFVWVKQTYVMGWDAMIEQLLLNIVMFVPFGLLLPMVFQKCRKWWRTGLWTLLLTVTIETLQYFMGRSADIDDVLTNVVGSLLGYALFAVFQRLFLQKRLWNNCIGNLPQIEK